MADFLGPKEIALLETLPIVIPEAESSSHPFSSGNRRIRRYKPDDLKKVAKNKRPRTDFFEKTLVGIRLITGRAVPYAFQTEDQDYRSLDAGCIGFLTSQNPPRLTLVLDDEGFIGAVEPTQAVLELYGPIAEKLMAQVRPPTTSTAHPGIVASPSHEMRTWIFQGNPARFDIAGYLRASTGEIVWRVATNAMDIQPGDRVYLWRSGEDAGAIAECEVVEPPRIQPDDPASVPFWVNPHEAIGDEMRVRLRLKRVVSDKRQVLRRKWLAEDHELRDLTIIRWPAGTNFSVSVDHAARLASLWANTGKDWTYPEVVAAMWAYDQLWDQPKSKKEGSLIDKVSRQIGRVIPGVYNKIMNLRALDPRVEQEGLPGTSDVDERVWEEFFDPAINQVRTEQLQETYERLWNPQVSASNQTIAEEEATTRNALEAEERRLSGLNLQSLMDAYNSRPPNRKPRRRAATTSTYERDPLVIAITKQRAGFRCEVPACSVPAFLDGDHHFYVETHHLVRLADGGPDIIDNTACVCALHHRELHVGQSREGLTEALQRLRGNA